ncbi:MAG TPA: C40 family peptidase, partial [Acidimicrobiales bacterium]|nr:C40 family peptidase [Acidimicrobiales bacterium]
AARIAEEGHRLDVLSEQVDAATIAEQQVRAALVAAEARAAATDAATRAAEALLADEALAAYTDAGNESLSPTAESLTHVAPDLIAAYGAIVAGSQQATITALHQLRRRQADDEAGLRDAEAQATATAAALTADRDAASSAQAEQRATLRQVQGGMATLVAAAEARRAAAAATIEQQSLASSGVSLADARPSAVAPATAATVPTARQAVAAPGGAGPTTSGRPPAAGPAATAAPARPTTSAATSTSTSATSRPASTTSDAPAGTATTGGPTPGGQASGGQVGPQAPGAPDALRYARAQIGKPYQWGAAGPDSFDCSGLVMMAWRSGGVDFPHLAQDQYDMTEREPLSAALPGDLIFFGTPGNVYHVGIYVGGGQMIDAPQTGEDVQQQSIYWTDLLGAGRVTG